MIIPTGQMRRIDDMGVFLTTALFSIFAYVWMFIVLVVWTPDEIEIIEAVFTLAFFILLVILAFIADRYNAYKKKKLEKQQNATPSSNRRMTVNKDDFYRIVQVRNKDPNYKGEDSEKEPLTQKMSSNKDITNPNLEQTQPSQVS